MKTQSQYYSHPGRKLALWGLAMALALASTVGSGAVAQGGIGRSTVDSSQSSVGGVQSAAKSEPSPLAIRRSPFAHTPPANLPLVNPQTSTTRTITFSYDRSGRLASANYGDGVLLVYDYDPAGNLQRVTDHFDVFLPLVAR